MDKKLVKKALKEIQNTYADLFEIDNCDEKTYQRAKLSGMIDMLSILTGVDTDTIINSL